MQANNPARTPAAITWVHHLDPRPKLFLLVASFVMVLLPQSPQVVALATLVVLAHVTLLAGFIALHLLPWDRIPGLQL